MENWRRVTVAAVLALATGCSKEKPDETAVPVEIVSVEKTPLQQSVAADAVLFPIAQSALVPKISAPVKTFLVHRGSQVRAGQLVAVLENRDLAAAAQENRGTYDQAQAAYATTTAADLPQEVQKAQLDVQAAKQLLDSQQKVYDNRRQLFDQGALPRKELDQAAVDLTNARNQYELAQKHLDSLNAVGKEQTIKSAKGQLESAQGKYEGASAQLSYSEIRSPISGFVTDRPLFPGEMATAGTPLLTVMDLSEVIAKAHVPQQSAASLKVGDSAAVMVPGFEKPFPGKVSVVSPALDPGSTTVEVWVQLKNRRNQLRPGGSAQVSIAARAIPDALTLPSAALLTNADGSNHVMLAGSDGRAHQQTVKTGIREGERVQIVAGLQVGQKVVSTGAYGLPDNTKITSAKAAPEEKRE